MANSISDVKVNITVENVINPAAFGVPLLLALSDNAENVDLDYTECYSLEDVEKAAGNLRDTEYQYRVTADAGAAVTGTTLSDTTSTAIKINFSNRSFDVEDSEKSYGDLTFTKRVKAIGQGDLKVSGFNNFTSFISVYGICSSKDSTVDVVFWNNTDGVEVARQTIGGEELSKVTFELSDSDRAKTFSIYGESAESKTLHIYGIDAETTNEKSEALIKAAETMFIQEYPPEKIAILAAGKTAFKNYLSYDWRQCVPVYYDKAHIAEIAATIEASEEKKVLFVYEFPVAEDDNSLNSKYRAFERTFVLVSDNSGFGVGTDCKTWFRYAYLPTAALVANTCSKAVGSITYKNQVIEHCEPIKNITKGELTRYHNANWNVLVTKAGYDVTSEGKTLSGEYLDIVDAKDWLIMQIEYRLQQALIHNDKIPYTNNGINYLASIVVDVLNSAWQNGMINTTDGGAADYTVNFAPRSETKESDRAARRYVEGKFSFGLAGAIHTVTVNGTILI